MIASGVGATLLGRNSYTGSASRGARPDARAYYAECTRKSVGESGVAGLLGKDKSSGSVCSGQSSQRQSGAMAAGGLGVSGSQLLPEHLCRAAACRRLNLAPQRHAKGASPSWTSAWAFN